jgi:hypothetical protein
MTRVKIPIAAAEDCTFVNGGSTTGRTRRDRSIGPSGRDSITPETFDVEGVQSPLPRQTKDEKPDGALVACEAALSAETVRAAAAGPRDITVRSQSDVGLVTGYKRTRDNLI